MTPRSASRFSPTVAPMKAHWTPIWTVTVTAASTPTTPTRCRASSIKRVNAFPSDSTQWFDQDGDGFGTTPHPPTTPTTVQLNSAHRPLISSAVTTMVMVIETRMSLNPLRGDATRWRIPADEYGDNWGDPSWNATRDDNWPGQFVPGATNADYCPLTTLGLPVDEEGCHVLTAYTDLDGVTDDADNCPTEPKGEDGFYDGCPRPVHSSDDGGGLLGDLSTGLIAAIAGGCGLAGPPCGVVRAVRAMKTMKTTTTMTSTTTMRRRKISSTVLTARGRGCPASPCVQHRNGQQQRPFLHAQTRWAGSCTEKQPPARLRSSGPAKRTIGGPPGRVKSTASTKTAGKKKRPKKKGGCCRKSSVEPRFERRKSTLT